jgi:hypothetical protein
MDAESYLYDLGRQERSLPLVHGWTRDGLVVAAPGSNRRLVPVSDLKDAEVFEFLNQGLELLIYERAVSAFRTLMLGMSRSRAQLVRVGCEERTNSSPDGQGQPMGQKGDRPSRNASAGWVPAFGISWLAAE